MAVEGFEKKYGSAWWGWKGLERRMEGLLRVSWVEISRDLGKKQQGL